MRFNSEAYDKLYPRPTIQETVETSVPGYTPTVDEVNTHSPEPDTSIPPTAPTVEPTAPTIPTVAPTAPTVEPTTPIAVTNTPEPAPMPEVS